MDTSSKLYERPPWPDSLENELPIICLAPFANHEQKHTAMAANYCDILFFLICIYYDLRRLKYICRYFLNFILMNGYNSHCKINACNCARLACVFFLHQREKEEILFSMAIIN